jgi:hypothetical protein
MSESIWSGATARPTAQGRQDPDGLGRPCHRARRDGRADETFGRCRDQKDQKGDASPFAGRQALRAVLELAPGHQEAHRNLSVLLLNRQRL